MKLPKFLKPDIQFNFLGVTWFLIASFTAFSEDSSLSREFVVIAIFFGVYHLIAANRKDMV